MSEALERLARAAGIESTYTDYWGRERRASDAAERALLLAMGLAASDEATTEATLASLQTRAETLLEPVVLVCEGDSARIAVRGQSSIELHWQVVREDGAASAGVLPAGQVAFDLGQLPPGYHRLRATCGKESAQSVVIVAPARAYLPPSMENGRIWGLTVQLYGVRSRRNWGIGDFTDLRELIATVGRAGGSVVGLNPLHALHPNEPRASSPYSPSSRLWINPLYIDVEAVPEFATASEYRSACARPEFRATLAALREAPFVDYAAVAHIKRDAFEALYAAFAREHLDRPTPRGRAFRAFVEAGGSALEDFARYETIAETMHARDPFAHGWQAWPSEYASPTNPAVDALASERAARITFHAYLQFVADRQLGAATASSEGCGLYRDLAVGADLGGADAWADQRTIVAGAALGAPPDPLNALGQNWGLPPYSPMALRETAYRSFARLLAANMRHARVLRIDHVMALMRCFWIPRGRKPDEGAYVRYDMEAMLAIVALESQRNRCAVVGEDLGTVPPELRDRLRERGILTSKLTYFERDAADGGFLAPQHYPATAAASIGTHDLSPIAGWWTGDDIALRARLRLYPSDDALREAGEDRFAARFKLVDALCAAGAIDECEVQALREDCAQNGARQAWLATDALHRFLFRCPSKLLLVQLADLLGELEPVNVPGTVDEHPNWSRKRPCNIESDECAARIDALGSAFAAQEVSRVPFRT